MAPWGLPRVTCPLVKVMATSPASNVNERAIRVCARIAMRMILPPIRERRAVDRLLSAFFHHYKALDFKKAIATLCRFYNLKNPRVEWFEYIDWGRTAGKTYENGQIYLVHPENWKRGRKYNSERRWINMVYHEIGHFVFWADAEKKADMFASRMVRGLNHHKN